VISLRLEQPKQRESGQILELGRNVDVRRKEWRARSYKMEPAVKRVFIQYSGWAYPLRDGTSRAARSRGKL